MLALSRRTKTMLGAPEEQQHENCLLRLPVRQNNM